MNFKVGDVVTRLSHNSDCEFVIYKIKDNIAFLKGKCTRLNADAPLIDLKLSEKRHDLNNNLNLKLPNFSNNTLFGKILHLDGDSNFLKKCMDLYALYKVPAIGYYISENNMAFSINDLLLKHKPDVLVITGHDALSKSPFANEYMNSKFFLETIKNARAFQQDKDSMPIVVGGCQSNFKSLIEYANFASSPASINIAALDPAIIAIMIATTSINELVDVLGAVNQTSGKTAGMTGIDTRGVARKLY